MLSRKSASGALGLHFGQSVHYIFEDSSPVLIVLELVKTGTGWGQQHNVSRRSGSRRTSERGFQSLGVVNFHPFDL